MVQQLRMELHNYAKENEELKSKIADLEEQLKVAKARPGPKKGQKVSSGGKRILTPGKDR